MKSFEDLCKENYGRIYKYIYALTGCREPAEDLIQEVFTVALKKGKAFLLHENPPAFLYRTARNLTLTYLKRQRLYTVDYLDEYFSNNEDDIFAQIIRHRDRQIDESVYIGQVLGSLDDKQKSLYALRFINGKPISDIASEMDINEPAMRMRLVRLRREISGIVKDLKLDEY